MASISEQETTVTHIRKEGLVRIYSANPAHLRKLRADPRATEVRTYEDAAEFTVPASQFDVLTGFKRRQAPQTPEQKAASSERLRKARELRH